MSVETSPQKPASNLRQIETLVIFDIETTGLKTDRIRITELAALAFNRRHFSQAALDLCSNFNLSMEDVDEFMPRVTSSICLPIKPDVEVEETARRVSGKFIS